MISKESPMHGHRLIGEQGAQQTARHLSHRADTILIVLGLFAIFSVFVCGKVALYALGNMEAVVSSVPDDTGYFYKIAQNVVAGKGLTFDGVNETNGFQPLWLYLLLPLAWAMREAPVDLYLRAALIYQLSLVAIAGILFFLAMSLYSRRSVALASTVLFYLFGIFFANGMETGALVLCLSALLYFSLRCRPFFSECKIKPAFVFGLLLGLTMLARLDMVFLLIIIYTFLLWKIFFNAVPSNRMSLIRQSLASVFAFSLVTVPYFTYNKIHFGAIMPISGQLKNSFPYILQPDFGTDRFPTQVLLIFISICIFSAVSTFRFWRSQRNFDVLERYKIGILLIGTTSVLIHYFNTALFMKWAVFSWQFAFYFFHACIIFAYILDNFTAKKDILPQNAQKTQSALLKNSALSIYFMESFCRGLLHRIISGFSAFALRFTVTIIIVALFGVLLFLSYKVSTLQPKGWHPQAYRAAVWVRNNLPQDTRLAMKDAGLFGLLSERTVINLDGLVNNLQYQEYLRRKQLNEYFRQKGVQYLVQHAYWPGRPQYTEFVDASYTHFDITFRSQLYNTISDPIGLYREDEVYRSHIYYDGPYRTVFVIWRLR